MIIYTLLPHPAVLIALVSITALAGLIRVTGLLRASKAANQRASDFYDTIKEGTLWPPTRIQHIRSLARSQTRSQGLMVMARGPMALPPRSGSRSPPTGRSRQWCKQRQLISLLFIMWWFRVLRAALESCGTAARSRSHVKVAVRLSMARRWQAASLPLHMCPADVRFYRPAKRSFMHCERRACPSFFCDRKGA